MFIIYFYETENVDDCVHLDLYDGSKQVFGMGLMLCE